MLLSLIICVAAASPVFAQDSTAAQDQYAPGADSECPGAKVVNTTTGTGPKQSAPFQITGERFRITIANVATSQDPSLSGVSVFVNEANGDPVADFSQEGPGKDSSIINAGPGNFFIETNPANSSYTVVVEDCVDTKGNPPANSPGDTNNPNEVMDGTVPKGTLADTGGMPLMPGVLASGVVLLGAGLLMRVSLSRER